MNSDRGGDADEPVRTSPLPHTDDDVGGARRLMAVVGVSALLLMAWLVASDTRHPASLYAACASMAVKYPPQRLATHEVILEEDLCSNVTSGGSSTGTEDAAAKGISGFRLSGSVEEEQTSGEASQLTTHVVVDL